MSQSLIKGAEGLNLDQTNNRLYVGDKTNNRVLVFDVSSLSNGKNAANVLGQTSFTNSGSAATQSGMNGPQGMFADPAAQKLYATDSNNNRVLVFNTSSITNGMNAGTCWARQASRTAAQHSASQVCRSPLRSTPPVTRSMSVRKTTGVVLGFDKTNITNGMNASIVYGQPNYTTSTSSTTRSGIDTPYGVNFDASSGKLYLSDSANNRVLVYYVDNAPDSPITLAKYKNGGTTGIPGTTLWDFDSGTQSWSSDATLAQSTTTKRTGAGSLAATVGAGATSANYIEAPWQTRDLSSGSQTFSAWVYVPSSVTGAVGGNMYIGDSSHATVSGGWVTFTKDSWTYISMVLPVNKLTDVFTVGFYIGGLPSAGAKTFYIDDIQQGSIWTNETSVVFKGATSDTDGSDTNSICVEAEPIWHCIHEQPDELWHRRRTRQHRIIDIVGPDRRYAVSQRLAPDSYGACRLTMGVFRWQL